MEQVHGVDVSWMTQGSPKDKVNHKSSSPPKTPAPAQSPDTPRTPSSTPSSDAPDANGQSNGQAEGKPTNGATRRLSRSGSIEKQNGPNGSPTQRRNSWFSNISAKFSSSSSPPNQSSSPAQPQSPQEHQAPKPIQLMPQSPAGFDPSAPKLNPSRNAVLQHATKQDGTGPYIPAPPKSGQAGFLGVFRRLSSSGGSGGNPSGPNGRLGHGLVERKVLNVDQNRERCPISELKGAKLRRVAFCVDVEIAPMPKYADGEAAAKPVDKAQKRILAEKGEGEALKNPKTIEEQKENDGTIQSTGEVVPKEPSNEGSNVDGSAKETPAEVSTAAPDKEKDSNKKKEKKKKSEEERKARKEKRRKLAQDNGSIPMEIHYDTSDSSSDNPSGAATPKTTSSPTTNPVRIYRRCCQLRETPILKRITEQLCENSNTSSDTSVVTKLDLTGYWLQLPDLITLGDYLAVVPVREIILENSGLGDEGLRVILAGLLAVKRPASKRRRPKHELEDQGGVVERVVLKNNKFGPDGWKHLSLFLFMCRSLKYLDISHIPFPRQPQVNGNGTLPNGVNIPRSISDIFSKSLSERLGGATLEMLNIGETEASMEQLGTIMDGVIKCGVRRLGIAHNHLDEQGVEHVTRYLAAGNCEGLDLGGNDLKDHMEKIATSLKENSTLWALSIAGCNLNPSALCKILPTLVKLENFRFIDLSHNHDLFQSTPNAVGLLRRYLPKMTMLKRIHLQDVNMTSEQAIALVEILPEAHNLAHINLLGNAELVELADAISEEAQEEACALYASLMAATRVSKSIICVDIEVPGDKAGEIVKAMAKQVVAYCLRNMEQIPDTDIGAALASALSESQGDAQDCKAPGYPDVLAHLVGRDVLDESELPDDNDSAPDEDYVIGGTGVVKALACCLKNRGDESRRQSGEFIRAVEGGEASPRPKLPSAGKAKEMSKHLLAGARKIRLRLQPALSKAMANPGDEQNLRKLMFLDDTLQGIIKRFEDEYPDTREPEHVITPTRVPSKTPSEELSTSVPTADDSAIAVSDGEDESEIPASKPLSRTNSVLSKVLAEEEGRVHRAGHRFRSGFLTQEEVSIITTIDDIGTDKNHVRLLSEVAEDLGGEILQKVKEKGAVRAFKEDRDIFYRSMKDSDPDYWDRFVESQQKARANINVQSGEKVAETHAADESAVAD